MGATHEDTNDRRRMQSRMRAVVQSSYGPPDVLAIESVETPTPGDDEVLLRVHASIVSPVDCAFRAGDPFISRLFTGLRRPKHPVPGTLLAGEVVATGADVTRFAPGDRVFGGGWGAHAEYARLSEDADLIATPSTLTDAEAVAIVDGGLTALPFLRETADVRDGDSVLVNGASGSVGSAAVQLATHFGATVTGVCSTANVDLVRSLGADRVVDYTRTDFTEADERYDVIFDAVAKSTFGQCKDVLASEGIYMTTGLSAVNLGAQLWTTVIGDRRAKFSATGLRSGEDKIEDLGFLRELAESGVIRPVIDRRYPLEHVADAHRYVETGHKAGSVVVSVEDGR